jgi:hypothetical protein
VRLPHRNYLFYIGPVEAVTATVNISRVEPRTANLWWPEDRTWCVANEIYGDWTYVGGPNGLIDQLLLDNVLETLPVAPDDPLTRVEPWLQGSMPP